MILSLLLRSTLLLLVGNHSIAQEWYTQGNYGPEFYSPSMVQDAPPSFLEKREADISANESKSVYLPDYPSNVRQKRDVDDADNEQHSSDVTEYTPNDISGHVDELPENNVQSIDPNSSLDINDQRVTNDSYEYANSDTSNSYEYHNSDANSDTNTNANFYGNETTDQMLEDRGNDVMDERDEPANYAETSEIKTAGNNEVMQEGSGESSFQADDSHTINKVENDNKPEGENTAEADENDQRKIVGKEHEETKKITATTSSTTTSPNEGGSGSFAREEEEEEDDDEWVKGDEDDDEDEQPVKRQNLGMKLM